MQDLRSIETMEKMPRIIVIVGPTATGKSDLAVRLAKKFDGEIISADSRQVYTGMNIGTGKISPEEMLSIPHHLLDVVSPSTPFSVEEYKRRAHIAITNILNINKLPIVCGGTGFYIQSIVDNISFPEVPPNTKLRKELNTKTSEELFSMLKKLDPSRADTVDAHNSVRLIRAIEIAKVLGKVPPPTSQPLYTSLQIGIDLPDKELKERIHTRLLRRIEAGMIEEIEKLYEQGVSWERLEQFGLEYKYCALYLQNKISKQEMLLTLEKEIWHYAKRQRTWFKKDKRIKWFSPTSIEEIETEISSFIVPSKAQ